MLSTKNNLAIFVFGAFAFCYLLVFARMFRSFSLYGLFLIWNLFLALIPFLITNFLSYKKSSSKIFLVIAFCFWLLFLPNAPYIISDFEHLTERNNIPYWYDIMLLFISSFSGLLFGMVSVFQMEQELKKYFSSKNTQIIIVSSILLSGYGVFLGRYLRWNSWDVFSNPVSLFQEMMQHFIYPTENWRAWGVTFIYGIFMLGIYFFIKQFQTIQINKK